MKKTKQSKPSTIYIVSGASGASGEQLVHTVLAQFPEIQVPVAKVAHVRQVGQIESVVDKAAERGGIIVHTLVDDKMRKALIRLGRERDVVTIDLMGGLLSRLTDMLGEKPAGQPGLYRQLHQAYLDRVAAIEFSMAHDDGQNPQDLQDADIILFGVSRLGKTPLSMYLSVLGWKVANVPFIKGMDLPSELFTIDHRRIIGLSINPDQLLFYRKARRRRMGRLGPDKYDDPISIDEEIDAARRIFRRHNFSIIDVTNKPIETSADEVIKLITSRFKAESHKD
jgi:regulator of PEP synthase PpsR (kinase-PPPase family)